MTIAQPVIDQILALAATGQTRAAIADLFPGISRSSICGILWRRGIAPKKRPPLTAEEKAARAAIVVAPIMAVVPIGSTRPQTIKAAEVVPIRPRDLPVEISTTAVPLLELGEHSCHWPIGEDARMLFCGADRSGSSHASYYRHHVARSVAIDGPRVFAAKCPRPLLSAQRT